MFSTGTLSHEGLQVALLIRYGLNSCDLDQDIGLRMRKRSQECSRCNRQ
jgi:hypothetical protein